MTPPTLQFWFEFASTYSYLTALRIQALARAHHCLIEWKPFLLGPVFKTQNWNDSPFNIYPAKGNYMWKEMERFSKKYGLAFLRPSRFPQNGLPAARIACAGEKKPWLPDFAKKVYQANFEQDQDISSLEVLEEILTQLSLNPSEILNQANSEANKNRLRAQTEEAIKLGIFGAPSFIAKGELFWGNDRLEEAIAHAIA